MSSTGEHAHIDWELVFHFGGSSPLLAAPPLLAPSPWVCFFSDFVGRTLVWGWGWGDGKNLDQEYGSPSQLCRGPTVRILDFIFSSVQWGCTSILGRPTWRNCQEDTLSYGVRECSPKSVKGDASVNCFSFPNSHHSAFLCLPTTSLPSSFGVCRKAARWFLP